MSTRLFVSDPLINGAEVRLSDDAARYVGKVLRAKPGDSVRLFDGSGRDFDATITAISRQNVDLVVGESCVVATESALKLHLVQGVSRAERMDLVVQKATELGVKRITPVLTEFSVVKFDSKRADKRRDHWQKVAISAAEQCGRAKLPRIDKPISLNTWFGERTPQSDTDIILLPQATTPLLSLEKPATKLCLLIGPEGGFSPTEADNAAAAGFTAATLGPRILRTETAALAAIAAAQSAWGDFR